MIRNPRSCRPSGTDPPALNGSREAPTTAMVLAPCRMSCELCPTADETSRVPSLCRGCLGGDPRPLLAVELDRRGADVLFEAPNLRGAGDRQHHRGPGEEPCDAALGGTDAFPAGHHDQLRRI